MVPGLCKRLDDAVRWAGGNAREIDRLAGLTPGHTLLIISGRRTNPETATILALALTMGLSLDWLTLGIGDAPREEHVRATVAHARANAEQALQTLRRCLRRAIGEHARPRRAGPVKEVPSPVIAPRAKPLARATTRAVRSEARL